MWNTSSYVESFGWWIRTLEAWARKQLQINTKDFEIRVEEGVALARESKILYYLMWFYRGGCFYFYFYFLSFNVV
jgi:hypothetical protein